MTTLGLEYIFDPELIVPSETAKSSIAFWARLWRRVEDRQPRLGAASLEGLLELWEDPPSHEVIAPADFQKLIGRLASRAIERGSPGHVVCAAHWLPAYKPSLGHEENPARLLRDLSGVPFGNAVFVSTVEECWTDLDAVPSCQACVGQRVYLDLPGGPTAVNIMRAEFLRTSHGDPKEISNAALVLFPHLVFSDVAWVGLSTLTGDKRELTVSLVRDLGVLNDHACAIWEQTVQNHERIQLMKTFDVVASPEGTKTHRSPRLMSQRDSLFSGVSRRCEWHTKLSPSINRIHFAVEGRIVYIGKIVDHLDTA
ncbi:hypothetical protein BKA03_002745 [Demequina lutea]|uniref:Uncharacterized protein n=1 Tax=Demequina lutea TaxID=431489 RepID=A0A7Y9ZFW5_9MICO|nr:hypothetical protein [Demequina lutea]